jgi:hypothetical protein
MPEYPNKVSSVLERKYVSETNLNCIFVCLGDHIDFFLYDAGTDPSTSFSAYCWSFCGRTGDQYAKVCCYLTANLMVQPLVTMG